MSESKLSAFLHPEAAQEQEIMVSTRFKDEDGNPIPFKIRAITQEENDALVKKCTKVTRDRSGVERHTLDSNAYSHAIVAAGTVFPDFNSKEICDAWGVIDPLLVAPKMLYAGEYNKLADAIATLSGMGDEIEEEAKNL